MSKSRVGSKGELFPPKEIREKLGLRPHVKVIYRVEEGRLVVEPILSVEEVMRESPTVKIALEELHKFRKEISQRAES